MSTEANVCIQKAIQSLSTLKHFYASTAVTVLDGELERRGVKLNVEGRKVVLKRFTRTLSRLGFRTHCGEPQTVEIVRSL